MQVKYSGEQSPCRDAEARFFGLRVFKMKEHTMLFVLSH